MNYTVGKNAKDNWLKWKEASSTDTIFHLEKFSSPYVIVKKSIIDLSMQEITFLAQECLDHSKYKGMHSIYVFYTEKSNTTLGEEIGSFYIKSSKKKYRVLL